MKLQKANNLIDNLIDGQRVAVTHGELVLRPIDKLPAGNTKKTRKEILAHSETGHHHILESEADMDYVTADGKRAILVREVAKLWHNKPYDTHETRTIAPGAYEVLEKQEYNPFTKVMQRVFD